MTTSLVVHELWDLVIGDKVKPTIPVEIQNAAHTANANQASIDSATAELKEYMKDFRYATSLLLHSISDGQMHHIRPVITNVVDIWNNLQQKFDKKNTDGS